MTKYDLEKIKIVLISKLDSKLRIFTRLQNTKYKESEDISNWLSLESKKNAIIEIKAYVRALSLAEIKRELQLIEFVNKTE